MKMKKTIKIILELNPRELSAVYEGYRLQFPIADSQWFRKQVLGVPLLPQEVLSWLSALIDKREEDYNHSEYNTALKIHTSILHSCEDVERGILILEEEDIPELSTWAEQLPEDDIREQYSRCVELGMQVWIPKGTTLDFIPSENLRETLAALDKRIPGFQEQFRSYFGIQTMGKGGPFAHDVEAVLERQLSGQLTGTQLFPD